MGKLSGRLRAVLTTGAVATSAVALVGATPQPASAAPNECNNPAFGIFWHSEQDMADASASWCRNWVLDPGVGSLLDRDEIVRHADIYTSHGISRQFLWYAPKSVIPVQADRRWSYCKVFPTATPAR